MTFTPKGEQVQDRVQASEAVSPEAAALSLTVVGSAYSVYRVLVHEGKVRVIEDRTEGKYPSDVSALLKRAEKLARSQK